MPDTKLSRLKALWAAGDKPAALKLAAKFPRLGVHDDAVRKGHAALTNPAFYRELGLDVPALVEAAYAALIVRYQLPGG